VLDKHTSRSRRSTHYHLCLQDWTGSGENRHLSVARDYYDRVGIGATLAVEQKNGYFNYRWIESIGWPRPAATW
jgi:hypothetical protein